MTGESALRAAVRTQIDSSRRCTVPRVIPGSRTRRRNPKGSFLVIFSVYVLLYLLLDSFFLDRQHASTCSCLVIVVFVLKVFSHLTNGDYSSPPSLWANGNERGGACMSVTHECSVSACERAAITCLLLFALTQIISLGIL